MAAVLLGLVALGTVGFEKREASLVWLLREVVRVWVVDEPPERADAIVVLAGNIDRTRAAARLWHEGHAPLVLISNCGPRESDRALVEPYWAVLRAEGVPDSALGVLPGVARRTFHEAVNLGRWSKENEAVAVILVTDAFHTRRARWLCRNERDLGETRLITVAAPPRTYALETWWESPDAVDFLGRELVRFVFYWYAWPRGGLEAGRERGEVERNQDSSLASGAGSKSIEGA